MPICQWPWWWRMLYWIPVLAATSIRIGIGIRIGIRPPWPHWPYSAWTTTHHSILVPSKETQADCMAVRQRLVFQTQTTNTNKITINLLTLAFVVFGLFGCGGATRSVTWLALRLALHCIALQLRNGSLHPSRRHGAVSVPGLHQSRLGDGRRFCARDCTVFNASSHRAQRPHWFRKPLHFQRHWTRRVRWNSHSGCQLHAERNVAENR